MKFNKEYQETILSACDFDKGHFVIDNFKKLFSDKKIVFKL